MFFLVEIKQSGFERVVMFCLAQRPGAPIQKILVIELMGRHSNLFLLENENKSIIDNFEYEKETVKKNIYSIEQKLGLTFKEAIIIVDNLNCSIINISGFKRLSGSQLTRENITYILNSLKFIISESEKKKEIIYIHN